VSPNTAKPLRILAITIGFSPLCAEPIRSWIQSGIGEEYNGTVVLEDPFSSG